MQSRFLGLAVVLLTLIVLAGGCGGGSDPLNEGVKVTGSVTKGGTGYAGVMVNFSPQIASQMPKGARTDASGKFELKLLPGKYTVSLSRMVDASGNVPGPEADLGQMEANGELRESIPAAYSDTAASQLSADVPAAGMELAPFVVEGT